MCPFNELGGSKHTPAQKKKKVKNDQYGNIVLSLFRCLGFCVLRPSESVKETALETEQLEKLGCSLVSLHDSVGDERRRDLFAAEPTSI